MAKRTGRRRRGGFITLEWIALVTVLIIGTVGAVALVRNTLMTEYADLIEVICDTSVGS